MEDAAEEGLKKFTSDNVLKFFRAYAQILQGKHCDINMSNSAVLAKSCLVIIIDLCTNRLLFYEF